MKVRIRLQNFIPGEKSASISKLSDKESTVRMKMKKLVSVTPVFSVSPVEDNSEFLQKWLPTDSQAQLQAS
jgi:hypothetical protein